MAKQIIILDTQKLLGVGTQITVALWYPVPAGQETPILTGSAFRNASAAETTAIKAGQVVEEILTLAVPTATTQAQIKTQLIALYGAKLAAFNTRPNPNQFYGLAYDGSVWA